MQKTTDKKPIYITHSGPKLLTTPLLNKGSAFSAEERADFNLSGLIPARYETINEQVDRAYKQYCSFDEKLNKHIYLRSVQDKNETLFYKLLQTHLEEMMPIVYTPTVGDACERFSDIYRVARGLFVSHTQQDRLDDIFHNATKEKVKIIVVTDGERVLGLGDQGVGGMGISVGKLSLYTVCGGISPAYTLPVALDVGTNNQTLLDDPMYMGIREKRIDRAAYDEFFDAFMSAAQRRWPGVMIQFEDFAQPNAMPILERYRDKMCCFNDDIQGTATVTLGTLLAACRSKQQKLSQQTVVFAGAGSAGCGIAEQIIAWMCKEGLTDLEARRKVFMVDRNGLVTQGMDGLRDFQARLAQDPGVFSQWKTEGGFPSLREVVANVKPDILIGVSGQANLFTEEIIRNLHSNVPQPHHSCGVCDSAGNFAAVGDEDAVEHLQAQCRFVAHAGARLVRNASRPSRPSSLARRRAIMADVNAIIGSSTGAGSHRRMSVLVSDWAPGAPANICLIASAARPSGSAATS